jgi:hypothetical protein
VEHYDVRGRDRVERIAAAIVGSGGTVATAPSGDIAPFEFTVLDSKGSKLDLICYAFTANKYDQEGRPLDEHRFQVKYGNDFTRYHEIFIDPDRKKITLMFGVHDSLELFIAVDPAMHNPTWFSRSVEFKAGDLETALKLGWYGWERERTAVRRKKPLPKLDCRTEAVIAFRPEHFLRYVEFEAVATGLDPGERLLLSDRITEQLQQPARRIAPKEPRHQLEELLGLTAAEVLDVISARFRLLAAVRGGVAEHHLERLLRQGVPRMFDQVTRVDEDGKPDFEVTFRGRVFRVECKNVLRRPPGRGGGIARVDFQKTRASKGDPCSRYYRRADFEVLAACLHPVRQKWEFVFTPTSALAPHAKCAGRLSERVVVDESWNEDLQSVLATMS